MDSNVSFRIPESTPQREHIRNFGTVRSTSEKDQAIKAEADRRFIKSLQFVNASAILSGEYPNAPQAAEDNNYGGPPRSEIYEDPLILHFIKQVAALKIYFNKSEDQYHVDKKLFAVDETDPVIKLMEKKYTTAVEELVKDVSDGPAKKEMREIQLRYPHIDDVDTERERGDTEYIPDDVYSHYLNLHGELSNYYYESESFHRRDPNSYINVAEAIADKCVNNSYLEDLFSIYASSSQKKSVDVLYKEKVDRIVRENADYGVSEDLRKKETHIRTYIQEIYGVDLPSVQYVSKEKWQNLTEELGISTDTHGKNITAFIDYALATPATTHQGGGYIFAVAEDGMQIPVDTCFVVVDPERPSIEIAHTVFEELYHASGRLFQEKKADEYWPGWKNDGTGSLMEEGLAGEEAHRFFLEHYNDEYLSEGSSVDKLSRHLKGEHVKGEIHDVLPSIFMRFLINACGGDEFRVILRAARSNEVGALHFVRDKINMTLRSEGSDAYERFSKTEGHDMNRVRTIIQKLTTFLARKV